MVVRFNELNLDGDVHAGRQVELLQLVHGLGSRINNVEQPLVRALLEGFLGFFVRVRRAAHREPFDARWQRNRAGDPRPGALDGLDDFMGRLVNDPVVVSLQSDADALSSHTKNKLNKLGFRCGPPVSISPSPKSRLIRSRAPARRRAVPSSRTPGPSTGSGWPSRSRTFRPAEPRRSGWSGRSSPRCR